MLFHQREVLAHDFLGHIMSRGGIVLVDVRAFQLDGLAVDKHQHVGLPVFGHLLHRLDFDTAETHVVGNYLRHLAVLLHGHQQLVEVRGFGRPRQHVVNLLVKAHLAALAGRHADGFLTRCHGLALLVQQLVAEGQAGRSIPAVPQVGFQGKDAMPVGIVQRGLQVEVAHGCLGLRIEEHIPFDAAHAPHVLALQVGAGAPAEDFQGQHVLAGLHVGVDEELGGILGVLVVAHLLTVDVDIDAGLGAGNLQVDVTFHPLGRNVDVPAVNAHGSGLGQGGRLGIAGLELIAMVSVDGRAKALHLPVAGHLDVGPFRCVHGRVGDVGRQQLVAFHEIEFPRAVQRMVVRAFLETAVQGRSPVTEGHEVRAGFLPVDGHGLDVLPIGLLVVGGGSEHRASHPEQASTQQDLSQHWVVHN